MNNKRDNGIHVSTLGTQNSTEVEGTRLLVSSEIGSDLHIGQMHHDLDNLDSIFAVMRCCGRAVSHRSHPANMCTGAVTYRSRPAVMIH